MSFKETFSGWCFTGVVEEEEYSQVGPYQIWTEEQLGKFIVDNVQKYPELRVVDGGDSTVFHVVRQRLVFPLPAGLTEPPVWDPKACRFCPV